MSWMDNLPDNYLFIFHFISYANQVERIRQSHWR
jgi:hypothetical protein